MHYMILLNIDEICLLSLNKLFLEKDVGGAWCCAVPGEQTGAEKYELAMLVHQVGASGHPPSPVLAKEFPTAPSLRIFPASCKFN